MTIRAGINGDSPVEQRTTHLIGASSRIPVADDDMLRQAADRRATVAAQDVRAERARAAGL